ncbi:MAG: aldo/keto reductase [Anaerolineales bacterium]|uniref:potassium channel beta subunit family protein n=1 Tax=Candidatus Villigracilis affinis TaxID=3140682 RepID=UPI001DD14279|nr:aldo/keto reductase [Anaerolineales bacterium]MBK9602627.1 aldo/keto reductase [Anaerolineales bacterium]MBL0347028.1 aldo/keto reductase [Anaerolineales bacterium]
MKYRHLGKTGIQVSELSFGSWVTFSNQADVKAAVDMMAAAYDAGVNFFDNAEVYAGGKSEEVMGKALKELNWRRSSYLVSTKFFWGLHDGVNEKNTLNRKRLIEGIRGSLERLQLEYVDLIYCHRPDKTTPIEETVWAMHNIIERGQALYWGTSEWAASEIIEAIQIAERHHLHKPAMEQPQYNMFVRNRMEGDYERFYKEYNYGSTIWSPLASGLLTGKYKGGIPKDSRGALKGYDWLQNHLTDKQKLAKVNALEPITKELDCTLSQLALAWCVKNPFVSTVITGASRVEQVHENMKAADVIEKITPEIMARIDEIFEIKKDEDDD